MIAANTHGADLAENLDHHRRIVLAATQLSGASEQWQKRAAARTLDIEEKCALLHGQLEECLDLGDNLTDINDGLSNLHIALVSALPPAHSVLPGSRGETQWSPEKGLRPRNIRRAQITASLESSLRQGNQPGHEEFYAKMVECEGKIDPLRSAVEELRRQRDLADKETARFREENAMLTQQLEKVCALIA